MKPIECIGCKDFPCSDININGYIIPVADIDPKKVKAIMISEAPPENQDDYFYAAEEPFYLEVY